MEIRVIVRVRQVHTWYPIPNRTIKISNNFFMFTVFLLLHLLFVQLTVSQLTLKRRGFFGSEKKRLAKAEKEELAKAAALLQAEREDVARRAAVQLQAEREEVRARAAAIEQAQKVELADKVLKLKQALRICDSSAIHDLVDGQ
jgi:hypothetical protein